MVGGRWLVGGGGGGFLCVLVFFLFLLVVLVLMVEEDGENVIFGVGAATKGLRFFVVPLNLRHCRWEGEDPNALTLLFFFLCLMLTRYLYQ